MASCLERLADRCGSLNQVPHTVGNHHLVFSSQVLLLESLSKYLGDLLGCSGGVAPENKLRILGDELSQVLVLKLSLFHVVSDRKSVNPVVCKLLSHLRALSNVALLEI